MSASGIDGCWSVVAEARFRDPIPRSTSSWLTVSGRLLDVPNRFDRTGRNEKGRPRPSPFSSVEINDYLRVAQAYMLISMPTQTSAIFGVFQDIGISLVGGGELPLTER